MKYFSLVLLIATVISIAFAEETIEKPTKLFQVQSTSPEKSLKTLFETITRLVEGVLDGDKFVLNVLGLKPPLDLTNDQTNQLEQLLQSLDIINENLSQNN